MDSSFHRTGLVGDLQGEKANIGFDIHTVQGKLIFKSCFCCAEEWKIKALCRLRLPQDQAGLNLG